MASYLHLRVTLSQLSPEGEVCRLRLGRQLALGKVDCLGQSAVLVLVSAQLLTSRMNALVLERVGRLRLGRPLAIGTAGCVRQSAVHLPSSAQLPPNRPILVLKGCFRLGEPTRVPIPRHGLNGSFYLTLICPLWDLLILSSLGSFPQLRGNTLYFTRI